MEKDEIVGIIRPGTLPMTSEATEAETVTEERSEGSDRFAKFKRLLDIHIRVKTLDPLFHEKTEAAYEFAFDVYHKLNEKYEDTGYATTSDTDLQSLKNEAYALVEGLKADMYAEASEKTTVGTDNLVRSLADIAELICGNLRGFTK